ncbi:MAG: protease complex subunit PrcB family protein [Rubrobacter sp.]
MTGLRFTRCVAILVSSGAMLALSACGSESSSAPPEGTNPENVLGNLDFEEVYSNASGSGLEEPRLVVATDLEALQRQPELADLAPETTTPRNGGPYVAVFAGQRNTGGYSVSVEEVVRHGGRVEVVVKETGPPEGARATQALTYPFSVVAVRELSDMELRETDFSVTDSNRDERNDGDDLRWSVEVAGD